MNQNQDWTLFLSLSLFLLSISLPQVLALSLNFIVDHLRDREMRFFYTQFREREREREMNWHVMGELKSGPLPVETEELLSIKLAYLNLHREMLLNF